MKYQKRYQAAFQLTALTGTAALAALPASADLTVVQTTKVSAPGLQQMLSQIPEQQRSSLQGMVSPMFSGAPWVTTTYLQGSRVRTDMGQSTIVANAASREQFTLDNATRKYSIGAYDPFQRAAGTFTCRITPTSVTSQMLGHAVQQYSVALTSSVLPQSVITGQIWAAPDLPAPPTLAYLSGTPAAEFGAQLAKVRGLPLAYTLTYAGTPMGSISVSSTAVSLTQTPIAASVFRIPSTYTQGAVQTAQQMPSAGFPLGDGVPLDAPGGPSIASSALGLSAGSSADGNIDASAPGGGMVQQLLGSLGGLLGSLPQSGLGGAAASGSGGGLDAGSLGKLISPQMIQQLAGQLQSLLGSDGSE